MARSNNPFSEMSIDDINKLPDEYLRALPNDYLDLLEKRYDQLEKEKGNSVTGIKGYEGSVTQQNKEKLLGGDSIQDRASRKSDSPAKTVGDMINPIGAREVGKKINNSLNQSPGEFLANNASTLAAIAAVSPGVSNVVSKGLEKTADVVVDKGTKTVTTQKSLPKFPETLNAAGEVVHERPIPKFNSSGVKISDTTTVRGPSPTEIVDDVATKITPVGRAGKVAKFAASKVLPRLIPGVGLAMLVNDASELFTGKSLIDHAFGSNENKEEQMNDSMMDPNQIRMNDGGMVPPTPNYADYTQYGMQGGGGGGDAGQLIKLAATAMGVPLANGGMIKPEPKPIEKIQMSAPGKAMEAVAHLRSPGQKEIHAAMDQDAKHNQMSAAERREEELHQLKMKHMQELHDAKLSSAAKPDADNKNDKKEQNFANGGAVRNYQDGSNGVIDGPGGTMDDMVKANLSPGEAVINARDLAALGNGDPELGYQVLMQLVEMLKGSMGNTDEQANAVAAEMANQGQPMPPAAAQESMSFANGGQVDYNVADYVANLANGGMVGYSDYTKYITGGKPNSDVPSINIKDLMSDPAGTIGKKISSPTNSISDFGNKVGRSLDLDHTFEADVSDPSRALRYKNGGPVMPRGSY